MKLRKVFRIVASVLGLVCLALAGVFVAAAYQAGRTHDLPFPDIRADASPEGIARGAAIFHASCEVCHRPAFATRASGALMAEVPAWLGRFYAANLTSDPQAGIGKLDDGAIARMVRFGVNRDGHLGPMPTYGMSDADLAAVIGFLRTDDALFAPDPRPAPRSELSLAGKAALFAAGMLSPAERPSSGIQAPAPAASVAYGRYLADSVYQCGDCHTAGMDPDKLSGPDAYAGGADMVDAEGHAVYSPNLTKDPSTGIGRWTRDEFVRALREGIRPDGTAVGYPMPRFRGAREEELDALFLYLRSLPAKVNEVPGRVAKAASRAKGTARGPAAKFQELGCSGCHGAGARYHEKLAQAAGKDVAEVARWIRNPEAFLPGTPMPTYANVLDDAGALELAGWIVSAQGPAHASAKVSAP
ncbi:MAG: c-type cytochrome [Myxococcales bacterium]